MKHRKLNVELGGLVHLYKMSFGYFVTTAVNQALPFLFLPILTRYLSPPEYGSIALFALALAVSNSLAGVPMPTVIFKHFFSTDKKYIAAIIGNSIVIVGLFCLVLILFIIIFLPFLQSYLELSLPGLILIPFTSFAFIVFSLGLSVLQNTKKVLAFGMFQVGNTVISLFISLVFIVALLWGWQGRALGIIFSYFISALIAFAYLRKNGFVSFALSAKLSRHILRVVVPLIPNSFQSVIIVQAGIFFIQFYFSREMLGLYSIGFQLAVIIQLLGTTLCMSWSPFLFEQLSHENRMNKFYITRLFYALSAILVAGVLFINAASGLILKVMTTPEYSRAREFIPWFTVGFFFQGLYTLLFPILIKREKQNFISAVSFVSMLAIILLNILFLRSFGYLGGAYAFCLTHLLMFVTLFWKAQSILPLPWLRALKLYRTV
ncbi:MAG: oligosaccharide flippase family protein [Syntrophaceae bacterium]|nr:oligosaccharide flippase family protein [Syntrophaceae bacterium]